MKGLAEALVDAPKTGQAEREDSSTSSYQINKRIIPAIILTSGLWYGLYLVADAIRGMKPTIQLHEHPTKVEVIREVNQLDGYLPGVRK